MENLKIEMKPVIITDQNLKDLKGVVFKLKFEATADGSECEKIIKLLQSLPFPVTEKSGDKAK
jgi:hypothetical protein